VEGNSNRFRIGLVNVVPDDEWRSRMPRRDQACVTAATMPLLLRYGYPILNGHTNAGPRWRALASAL
ncbi:MAG: hypothetical protein ACRDTT_00840, partial [Pseudonocardiaceae bacterium]